MTSSALLLRRDQFSWWCAAGLAAPFAFYCFLAQVALGFYLAAAAAMLAGVAVLAIPGAESVAQSITVADVQPDGAQALPAVMKRDIVHSLA